MGIVKDVAGGIVKSVPVVGPIVSNIMRNRSAATNAREYRDWMEKMSGSAHQREVQDLRKAGLSKILAYGGQGASTPTATQPTVESVAGDLATNATSWKQANIMQKQVDADVNLKEAQSDLIYEQTRQAEAEADITSAQSGVRHKKIGLQMTELENKVKSGIRQIKKLDVEIKSAKFDKEKKRLQMEKEKVMNHGYKLINNAIAEAKKSGELPKSAGAKIFRLKQKFEKWIDEQESERQEKFRKNNEKKQYKKLEKQLNKR